MSVADTDCIVASGTGAAATPFSFEPVIDPVEGNILECTATGLRAIPAASDIVMLDVGNANFNSPPPAAGNGGWLMQGGEHIDTTNVAGHIVVPFPTPFPAGVLVVLVTIGSVPSTISNMTIEASTYSLTAFDAVFQDDAGAPISGGTYQVNYLAVGW